MIIGLKYIYMTILKLFLSYVIIFIGKKTTRRIINDTIKRKFNNEHSRREETLKSIVDDLIKYTFNTILLIFILLSFGIDLMALIAAVGVLSLIIGIAAQSLISDMLNGFFTVIEGYYDIGDYISIKDSYEGEVISLGIKTTTIVSPANIMITIPNSEISEIRNYSKMEYINYITYSFGYKEDILIVKKVIEEDIFPKFRKHYPKTNIEYLGVETLAASDVQIMIAITSDYRERFIIQRTLTELIKIEFDKNNIEIPFQQIVIHNT